MYRVSVKEFIPQYRKLGKFIQETHQCKDMLEIIEKIEIECNIKSGVDDFKREPDHYFEFRNKNHFLMFIIRWS